MPSIIDAVICFVIHLFCCILQQKMSPTYVLSVVQNVEICMLPISSYFSNRLIVYVLCTDVIIFFYFAIDDGIPCECILLQHNSI